MPDALAGDEVVYLSPETLFNEQFADRLAAATTSEQVQELLSQRPTVGEYRQLLGTQVVDGPDGTTVLAPKYGDKVVWINEAPEDVEDGSGHFAVYTGHDDDYVPQPAAAEEA